MTYRRNGKQVLCNDRHFGDGISEEAAALITDALNAMGYISQPDDSPDLFGLKVMVDSSVPPGAIQFRHPDGRRVDTLHVSDEPHCSIRQYGDQYACVTHKRQWDVDDTPPDSCEVPS